jgi:hypothetical protein
MRETLAIQPAADSANQPPPLVGFNAWSGDPTLREAVEREGGGWISARANEMGELVGSERLQTLAEQANRFVPELRTHDRFGNRIDLVEYHPGYHELMAPVCIRSRGLKKGPAPGSLARRSTISGIRAKMAWPAR